MYKIEVTIEQKEVDLKDDKKYDEQEIIGQNVNPGTILKAGDKITLYIPKLEEKYPDIVKEGWSVSELENWAKEKEIVLNIVYQETDEYEEGTIISQSRGTDTVIVKGATLKVVVAKKRTTTDDEDKKDDDTGEDSGKSDGQN